MSLVVAALSKLFYLQSRLALGLRFFVQNRGQQRAVDLDLSVVADEAEFAELVMKKLTRDRVVPIISANVSWLILALIGWGLPSLPKLASSRSRAKRFSLELKS